MPSKYISDLVSIVIPVYNRERFIAQTIESVLQQTYQNFELLLIEDGSTDGTASILKEYEKKDARIVVHEQGSNQGVAAARNRGVREAKGQFLAFLDSDDLWYPEKLEVQIAFMKEKNIGFSYTNYEMVDEQGNKLGNKVRIPSKITYKALLKNTTIASCTVIFDREYVDNIQFPIVKRGEDTAAWLRILRENNMVAYGLDKVLFQYRRHKKQTSYNKIKMIKAIWHTYRNIEKLSLLYSAYCFIHYAFRATRRYFIKI